MTITQQLLRLNKFTRPGMTLQKVKAIAVHYTGDPGATAQNERDYFNGECIKQERYASCHYVVGLQGEVIQLIPDNEWSYCTNQANSYALSIEACHPDKTGKFHQATEKSLIELVAYLCKKYDLNPLKDVIRHYDVTGKCCPKYYVDNANVWIFFKNAVKAAIDGKAYNLPSYGEISSPTESSPTYVKSDTSCDFSLNKGKSYTFKISSDTEPKFQVGTANVFETELTNRIGNDYFYKITAVGNEGSSAGIYVNNKKICAVNINRSNVIPFTDTTGNFTIKKDNCYQFKTNIPVICVNGSVFQSVSQNITDGYYYTKFKAIGNVGDTAGFYLNDKNIAVGKIV